ncbi:DUF2487 family protein [Marininema halotolerans]|uniref:DUF2487 domain-containing protein n=1 Tax=Marininema halotolerans TaxID=1155944 RepID=A0A1I6TZN3_9BACL|nr:DUF2487 family protein [Marininema halotolerans]SFS94676.1 Protein of unknown function [Marininema halotolerans]
MRLTKLAQDEWLRSAPFVDTLLIPVYRIGMTDKNPDLDEAKFTEKIARGVEQELTGRLLLMPAVPYGAEKNVFLHYVNDVIRQFSSSGFHYCFVIGRDSIFSNGLALNHGGCGWIPIHSGASSESDDGVTKVVEGIIGMWDSVQGNDGREFGKK